MSDGQEGTGNTGRELWMSKKWVGKELCPCMASWAGGGELSTGLQEDLLRDRVSPVLSNMVFNHTLSHSTFEEKKRQIDVLLFYLMFFKFISGDNPPRNGLN